jgi:capsular polysaccharide biosynthesis protein
MELHSLVAGVRRRRRLILLSAVLGLVVAGMVLQFTGPPKYAATATLLLDPNAVTSPQQKQFTGDPERFVGGQVRLLESEALAQEAAGRVPGETGRSIAGVLTLSHVPETDLVDVTATTGRAVRSRDIANALVQVYVEQRRAATKATVDGQLAGVRKQLAQVRADLRTTTRPSQASQQGLLLNQYQQLLAQESTLASPGVTQDATDVIDPAVLPRAAHRQPAWRVLAVGLAIGTALGVALAVLLEARNPRVGTLGELERTAQQPVVASFPRGRSSERAQNAPPARQMPPARVLASVLIARPQAGKPRLLAVSGTGNSPAPLGVCRALVAALTEQGLDAVLLDLDRPLDQVDEGAQDRTAPGEQLTRQVIAPQARGARPTALAARDTSRSRRPDRPGRRPTDEQARALVEALPPEHEVVVLALPAVLDSPLAVSVSRWTESLVVVVDVREATQRELDLTLALFDPHAPDRLVVAQG